ncbi:MAG: 16S rRNA (adenine(1518)-N(6)/adenine(1519)-N(6))-dimethyltransferase RsmA [Patescibacteria group bacterium]
MSRLGQHFLKDKVALKKIVDALDLRSGDIVIEIGAGHGELTRKIINFQLSIFKNDAQKIKIIAIEKDNGLAKEFARNFQCPISKFQENADKLLNENFVLFNDDVLKILAPLIEFLNLKIENCKLKICGNIPYYITGKLLRILSELENKPEVSVFTIQKEVAERMCALPPRNNRLAAITQFWTEPKILEYLAPGAFNPPPEVESAIIRLKIKDQNAKLIDAWKYYETVRILFQQPRQTILNNLARATKQKRAIGTNQPNRHKSAIIEKLSAIEIDPESRPQNLSVGEIIQISSLNL